MSNPIDKFTESQRGKLKIMQILRLSDLFYSRKIIFRENLVSLDFKYVWIGIHTYLLIFVKNF